jgi:hypothetical protein
MIEIIITVALAVLASVATHIFTIAKIKSSRAAEVFGKQLKFVFKPLEQRFHQPNIDDNPDLTEEDYIFLEDIIKRNYSLIPANLLNEYYKITASRNEDGTYKATALRKIVWVNYNWIRKKLEYPHDKNAVSWWNNGYKDMYKDIPLEKGIFSTLTIVFLLVYIGVSVKYIVETFFNDIYPTLFTTISLLFIFFAICVVLWFISNSIAIFLFEFDKKAGSHLRKKIMDTCKNTTQKNRNRNK